MIKIGISINSTRVAIGLGTSGGGKTLFYDINSRFEVPLDAENQVFANQLMTTIKNGGCWDKLYAFYNFWIHDEQAARINWKGDYETLTVPFDGVNLVNEPLFDIADGIYGTEVIYSGMFIMDSYLDEIVSSGNYSIGYHQRLSNGATPYYLHGCNDVNNGGDRLLLVKTADTTVLVSESESNKTYTIPSFPATIGLTMDSDRQYAFLDGVNLDNIARVAGAVPHAKLGILGRNNNGNYSECGNARHTSMFYVANQKLTENEHKIISDAHAVWRSEFTW